MPRLYLFVEGRTEQTFADNVLALFYSESPTGIANLETIAQSSGNIELINDGPTTAPSKRIIAEFPDYERSKVAVGTQVAELIGLARIRQKCQHFDGWVAKLERLGEPIPGFDVT